MLLQRQYMLQTWHTVWRRMICMYYFSCWWFLIILCTVFLISILSREFLFKNCGEIVDIRLHTDHNGRFKGHGHVEFATTEAAQKVSYIILCSLCKSFWNCQNHFKDSCIFGSNNCIYLFHW